MEKVNRTCPSCGGEEWKSFLKTKTGRIISGDQRILSGNLDKVICTKCGVVANAKPFSESELDRLYGAEYELNTLNKEEHQYFTKDGPIARSKAFFDWVHPHISQTFEVLTEIGCGEGNVLVRFQNAFPNKSIIGIDGSERAAQLAKQKNLKITRNLITHHEGSIEASDIILSINVIEHVENIPDFIKVIKQALKKDGRILFCLPIQDRVGYDLFFAEHVWHFTAAQFRSVLEFNGLDIIYEDHNHPIHYGIGLFVCEPTKKEAGQRPTHLNGDLITISRDQWLSTFDYLNQTFRKNHYSKLGVFGSGEVFTLLFGFTELASQNICVCLDEDPNKLGSLKHGIPVGPLSWLKENPVDAVLMTTNIRYHSMIKPKIEHFGIAALSYERADEKRK